MRLAAVLALAACGGASTPPPEGAAPAPCDVSDDAKAAAVFDALVGGHLDLDRTCVTPSKTFVSWVKIGPIATDIGCEYEHALYACRLVTGGTPARAMADAGYPAAAPERRRELIIAYLVEILGVPVQEQDWYEDFPRLGATFTPPAFDGESITYWEYWAGEWSGTSEYHQIRRPVSRAGVPLEPETLAELTLPYHE